MLVPGIYLVMEFHKHMQVNCHGSVCMCEDVFCESVHEILSLSHHNGELSRSC